MFYLLNLVTAKTYDLTFVPTFIILVFNSIYLGNDPISLFFENMIFNSVLVLTLVSY